jgi:hypothetical protein
MILLKPVLFHLLFAFSLLFSWENLFVADEPVIAQRGFHGKRQFGDLMTEYTIDKSGKITICTLYVSTILVGIESLTVNNPTYQFDVKVGLSSATGFINLNLADSPLISKLGGNFNYTASANNTSYTFKGDLIGWYNNN